MYVPFRETDHLSSVSLMLIISYFVPQHLEELVDNSEYTTVTRAGLDFGSGINLAGVSFRSAIEIARSLGVTTILIHRYSSILSAYGMALADR